MNMWTGFADADLALLLGVQATLNESIQAAGAGRDWRLPTECVPAIGRMLLRCVALRCVALRCDEAVANVPKYRYVDAWEKLSVSAGSTIGVMTQRGRN
ncbi:hypothetical protein B2G74_00015 [Burkholderia sp. A27]|nr:hypothetical protein B2G74_00015 [Burkholderia sp. A27]